MTRHVTMSLEPVIKVVSLGTRHQTVLKSVTVTCMDITAVFFVENALNQSNVIMSTGPV